MTKDNLFYIKLKKAILKYGRPIEALWFNYLFEDGDQEDVIDQLSIYQNEDGGFGHGLEPDYINPNSSPIQTWTAINILRTLNIDSNHPMILSILTYLESSYQPDLKRWLNTIPSNDSYPRAPWWNYVEKDKQTSFNPSISIAGFILLHSSMDQPIYQIAKEVIYEGLIYLELNKEPIEMHELSCFMELANDLLKLGGSTILSDKLTQIYKNHIDKVLNLDHQAWFTSYTCKPSQLIHSHPSFLSDSYVSLLKKEAELSLSYQDEEGSYPVTWAWNQFEDEFIEATRTWKAIIALNYLRLYKSLNML